MGLCYLFVLRAIPEKLTFSKITYYPLEKIYLKSYVQNEYHTIWLKLLNLTYNNP